MNILSAIFGDTAYSDKATEDALYEVGSAAVDFNRGVNTNIKVDSSYEEEPGLVGLPHVFVLRIGNKIRVGKTLRPRKHIADLQRRNNFYADEIYVSRPTSFHKYVRQKVARYSAEARNYEFEAPTFEQTVQTVKAILEHRLHMEPLSKEPTRRRDGGAGTFTPFEQENPQYELPLEFDGDLEDDVLGPSSSTYRTTMAAAFKAVENRRRFDEQYSLQTLYGLTPQQEKVFMAFLSDDHLAVARAAAPYVCVLEYANSSNVYVTSGDDIKCYTHEEYVKKVIEDGDVYPGSTFEDLRPYIYVAGEFPEGIYSTFGRIDFDPEEDY